MISFDAGSLRATILAIGNKAVSEQVVAQHAAAAAGAVLLTALRTNLSLRDHKPGDLAKLDHPYARRHGSIKIHQGPSKYLQDGTAQVHSQTGELLRATYLKLGSDPSGPTVRVGIDPARAPHAAYVLLGTSRMLPRDVVNDTMASPTVKKEMMRTIVAVMGKHFRSQGAVRFGP